MPVEDGYIRNAEPQFGNTWGSDKPDRNVGGQRRWGLDTVLGKRVSQFSSTQCKYASTLPNKSNILNLIGRNRHVKTEMRAQCIASAETEQTWGIFTQVCVDISSALF